jgi:DNA-binding LacI/PurR family transcriptional regulator/DNA-binding transcriptional regulator YhcF (GntR family)
MNDSSDVRRATLDVTLPAMTAGRKLYEDLRNAIETGRLREGDRITPIRELAAKYEIAFDTARAAVGQLERLALVRRRRGAGTFVTARPAARSEAGTSDAVALLIESKAHLMDHLTADLVDLLQQRGLPSLKLAWRPGAGAAQLDNVLKGWERNPPRAVVIQVGPETIDVEIDKACKGKTLIVETFRSATPGTSFSTVNPDNIAAVRVAARTLLDRGHRRIGLVSTPRTISRDRPWTLRKRTMEHTQHILMIAQMMRERGLNDEGLTIYYNLVRGVDEKTGPQNAESVAQCAAWLKRARPTGVMGGDFRLAAVCRAAEQLGLKIGPGKDLELVGVGNTPWSEALDFDSVSLREDLIARHIADLITSQLSEPAESAHHIVVAPKLVTRTGGASTLKETA